MAWLKKSNDYLPGTPRYSTEAQFFSNPSQAHSVFTECLLAEAKPISVTFNQRELSQGLVISSEHILNTTLTPKNTGLQLKKSPENPQEFSISSALTQDQPSAAHTCISNIMHAHDLADSSNVTQQGNFLGPDGVFLDRSAVNRMGSVIWGIGYISTGSGNLGKGLQYMALNLCSLLLKFWSQENLTVTQANFWPRYKDQASISVISKAARRKYWKA